MTETIQIGKRAVGRDAPCFIIAEAGVNHNGDLAIAHRLVDTAFEAGADAVKFQAFRAENIVTAAAPKAAYQIDAMADGDATQFAMLKSLELDAGQHAELKAHCEKRGITYLCTPYDLESLAMLDAMAVEAFKISSTDTTNLPYLQAVAGYGRAVILSTGLCTLAEVEAAVGALAPVGDRLAILHCTSEYPAPVADSNLRAMHTLAAAFHVPIGFSDHTAGIGMAPYSVAAGAAIVEKHITLDRTMPGPDHKASIEPSELAEMVTAIRTVEAALGDGIKRPKPSEEKNREIVRKSLVAATDIRKGERLSAANVTAKRPGSGISPASFAAVVGAVVNRDIGAGEMIAFSDLDRES